MWGSDHVSAARMQLVLGILDSKVHINAEDLVQCSTRRAAQLAEEATPGEADGRHGGGGAAAEAKAASTSAVATAAGATERVARFPSGAAEAAERHGVRGVAAEAKAASTSAVATAAGATERVARFPSGGVSRKRAAGDMDARSSGADGGAASGSPLPPARADAVAQEGEATLRRSLLPEFGEFTTPLKEEEEEEEPIFNADAVTPRVYRTTPEVHAALLAANFSPKDLWDAETYNGCSIMFFDDDMAAERREFELTKIGAHPARPWHMHGKLIAPSDCTS
jgi:hypothetical protein